MQLHIYKDSDETTTALAEWITSLISKTLLTKDKFTIALSGGETPKALYKKLAAAPYLNKIDWSKIHFFWGDERVVPFTDERNNAKMAYDNLLSKINSPDLEGFKNLQGLSIPEDHIHRMRTDINPEESAMEYEKILHQYFDNKQTTFDLVLLGMGDDGHTLSLFPNSLSLFQNDKWVISVTSKEKGERITLLPSVVNMSTSVAFLVTGSSKANTLKKVLEEEYDSVTFPAQLMNPSNNELHWFLNEDAAVELKK